MTTPPSHEPHDAAAPARTHAPDWSLRPATPDDATTLAAIVHEATLAQQLHRPGSVSCCPQLAAIVHEATLAQGRWPAMTADEEAEWLEGYADWSRESADGSDLLRVVEVDGQVVGRLRIERDEVEVAGRAVPCLRLCGLQLRPEVQGRGIGTAIVVGLQREAAERGGVLDLGVEHDNPDARRLYDRLGFVPVGRDEKELHMRWVPPAG